MGFDGRWHVFGIWHPEPAAPLDETMFLHASADDLEGAQWTIHDSVLHARTELGETHVWAPHVIHHEGRYWMFYAGGTEDHTAYRMTLATSEDLFTWTPHEQILFEDGFDARDPMVIHDGQRWLMYYTRNSVATAASTRWGVRTSEDLLTWSEPAVAYESTVSGSYGGPTESPVRGAQGRGLGPVRVRVHETTAPWPTSRPIRCASRTPGRSTWTSTSTAPRSSPIQATGRTWITGGGWGRGGLSIRELQSLPGG